MKKHEFSNYILALTVVACSAILFGALAFALGGKTFSRVGRDTKANFADITGIKVGSQVKFSGALAGIVTRVRILPMEERVKSTNPGNAIQLTLSLYKSVPPLPNDTSATIVADTLLSDKFVELSAGTPSSPALTQNDALQGLTPVTFDAIARSSGTIMSTLDTLSASMNGDAKSILPALKEFLAQAQGAASDARAMVKEISLFVQNTKQPAQDTLAKLEDAAKRLQSLSQSAESLVKNNEKDIRNTIVNLDVTMQNMKVTSTYAKIFTQTLAERPSILVWGNRNLPVPTQQQILRSVKPISTP
ncbi:MAG: MlaD family protein [Chthoniobacterales bacterium]